MGNYKKTFNDSLEGALKSIIYGNWGPVVFSTGSNNEETIFSLEVADMICQNPSELNREVFESNIIHRSDFDISDVDFNDKFSVLNKVNNIISTFEQSLYE